MAPVWRLRHGRERRDEIVIPLTPRLVGDDMIGTAGTAAIKGWGSWRCLAISAARLCNPAR